MIIAREKERFALRVIKKIRRWSGVKMRPHPSATLGEHDGVEFRLNGRQIGHVHEDCSVHLPLTKALKESVVREQLAEPLAEAPRSGWVSFSALFADAAERAIWLLRLNYVRLRRQRLTPDAAASSELLQLHEAALGGMSPDVAKVLQRTQVRSRPRPLPTLEA